MILHANEEPPIPRLKAEVEGPEESSGGSAKARDVDAAEIGPSLPRKDVVNQKGEGTTDVGLEEPVSIKSDSEAETIVLLEDEAGDTTVKERNVIAHGEAQVDDQPIRAAEPDGGKKEGTGTAAANHDLAVSGGLRSPHSSSEAGVQPFREDHSNSGQALPLSDLARPSDQVQSNKPTTRKRKHDDEYGVSDDEKVTRGRGQQRATVSKRRDAEEQEEIDEENSNNTRPPSHTRSPSPDFKPRRRSARSKSNETLPNGNGSKRRKLPPLVTTREGKLSDEHQFDSLSNSDSPDPLDPGRTASREGTIMSPVKLAPNQIKRDKIGRTLLAKACSERKMDAVLKALDDSPGDINVADYAGNTPLQIASLTGYAEIVKVLIEHGADVECQNNERDTPLIDAVENGHLEVVQLLLAAGANPRQGNLNGAEPLELVDSDKESPEAIKSALTSACKNWVRRQSEDHSHQAGPASATANTRENGRSSRGASTISPRQSPPVTNPRSPPAPGTAPRRKTGRSEATRNDLLWIKPTLENLREFAGKGDLVGVMHILNINPRADAESLIAAARGGHDEVIQFLLGLGGVDPDSKPVRAYKAGYNTPMLAAIGRGNEKVIQLFLDQPKFDPTRKDYRGFTYHEISKERQGINWEKEYEILKQAYDKATQRRHGKSGQFPKGGTDSSSAKRDATSGQGQQEGTESSSPEGFNSKKEVQSSTHRAVRSENSRAASIKKEPEADVSEHILSNKERLTQRPAICRNSPSNVGSVKERSSDKDIKALGRSKEEGQKAKRRQSDLVSALSDDEAKAKRTRLVFERSSKDPTGRKRRESNASTISSLSRAERFEAAEREYATTGKSRRNSTTSMDRQEDGSRIDVSGTTRFKSEQRNPSFDTEEKSSKNKRAANSTREVGSKRQRNSISPRGSEIKGQHSSNDQVDEFKQKRRKLETQLPNQDSSRTRNDAGGRPGTSHVQVASMTRSPEEIAASGGYTHLPFETQGHNVGQPESEHGRFGVVQDRKETRGGHGSKDSRQSQMVMQGSSSRLAPVAKMEIEKPKVVTPGQNTGFLQEQDMLAKKAAREKEEQERTLREQKEKAERAAKEKEEQERILREQKEKAEKAQAEMARKAKLKAQEWRKRVFEEEHQRKLQAEKEMAERKMREEAKLEEERRRAEEAERQAQQLREQRAEQERIRREEIEKRRAELEERQRLEFLRRQEQQERSRRDALPYALQRLADLPSHLSQMPDEVRRFLPLYTVELKELDPGCHAEEANELWMINFQAAVVLGVGDLALSQCKKFI